MNSFYGGKPGASFIIVKSFDSYQSMVTAFENGDSYTEVQYDEYVIISGYNKKGEAIDTQNKNSIYRRGYDYNDGKGGAIFIANIGGPAGGLPNLFFLDYGNEKLNGPGYDEKDPYADNFGEGSFTADIITPEMTKDGTVINNTLSYKILNKHNENGSAETYIGLQIPEPVVEIIWEPIDTEDMTESTKLGLFEDKSVDAKFYKRYIYRTNADETGTKIDIITTTEDNPNTSGKLKNTLFLIVEETPSREEG